MSQKLIYYYQSFSTLKPVIDSKFNNVYIYVSSLHFGTNIDGTPYLHLNDSNPSLQPDLIEDLKISSNSGINILVMLGGAGGAYTDLFNNFEIYYNLLKNFLLDYKFIKGIDLDIEEYVDLDNVIKLIDRLKTDFGDNFIITMAPIASAMIGSEPGLGGFCYKKLNNKIGDKINWFNVQCYGCYTYNTINLIINNGYLPNKIVMGMLGDDFNSSNFQNAILEYKKVVNKYPNIGGSVLWEYGDTTINPIKWGNAIQPKNNYCIIN